MKNPTTPLRTILFAVLFLAPVAAAFLALSLFSSEDSVLERSADSIIASCAREPSPLACYDEEIPKLMDRGLTMEKTFAVTRIIQEKKGNYWYCHVLAHELAENEVAKDPSQLTNVLSRCPVNMCANGCLHGAFQERYRNETPADKELDALVDSLSEACVGVDGRAFTQVEKGSCAHAVGHLMIYATDADTVQSLALCDRLSLSENPDIRKNMSYLCYRGVFMQLFQPLDITDETLVEGLAPVGPEGVATYCAAFDGERKEACRGEAWPLFIGELRASADGAHRFCTYAKTPIETYRCYETVFYILAAQFNLDEERISAMCDQFTGNRRGQCYGNSASRFLDTDANLIPRAVALCARAARADAGELCYQELLFDSVYDFGLWSSRFNKLCAALPAPWSTRCFAGEGATTVIHP